MKSQRKLLPDWFCVKIREHWRVSVGVRSVLFKTRYESNSGVKIAETEYRDHIVGSQRNIFCLFCLASVAQYTLYVRLVGLTFYLDWSL